MSGITKEELQTVVREVLNERKAIGGDQHHIDHEFIRLLKEREERRVVRIEKFKLSIIGALASAVVVSLIWIAKLVIDNWPHGTGS